ncbi:MAG: ABC transporter ATP-binding protein [Aeromonadaceae bacterium]|nr:ABC transporter ATP-binding protein [Aeromonadaceae bacterium]
MTWAVEFSAVSRHYGQVKAVDKVSLQIEPGEFFSMLGPSGSGKTTCLRLMAGFEQPDLGAVRLSGVDAVGLPPYQRDVNTVFQDYALFPHLKVWENVAYGLKIRGVGRGDRMARAEEALAMVALDGYGDRKPAALSGGQRQRVALARALVNRPKVLLLDEPLGALDLKLREQMQSELKRLHRQLGITFVYVTHDQGEALSMSDRVAVFNKGRIEQLDTPQRLYTQPQTPFVARFVGGANVIAAPLAERLTGQAQPFALRPEHVHLVHDWQRQPLQVEGVLRQVHYHGAYSRLELDLGKGQSLAVQLPHGEGETLTLPEPGTRLTCGWSHQAMVPLREDGQEDGQGGTP